MVVALWEKLVASESVAYADVDGEAVLLNVTTGVYFGLDGVGTDIWKILEAGATEEEIVARLLDEYDVEAAQLQSDVATFIGTLRSNGLVRVVSD